MFEIDISEITQEQFNVETLLTHIYEYIKEAFREYDEFEETEERYGFYMDKLKESILKYEYKEDEKGIIFFDIKTIDVDQLKEVLTEYKNELEHIADGHGIYGDLYEYPIEYLLAILFNCFCKVCCNLFD